MDQLEEKLIKELKKGNKKAFEQCYRLHANNVFTAIYKICRDKELANEILQETFLDVYKGINRYEDNGHLSAWIKRISFHKTINAIRRNYVFETEDHLDQIADKDQFPELTIENENLMEDLLKRLSPIERTVLWMYVVEQYKHNEIANIFGKSTSFSKTIVARALNKIKSSQEYKAHVNQR